MAKRKFKPDYSNYLAHFTKDGSPFVNEDSNPINPYTTGNISALDKLLSILEKKTIYASSMPWTKQNCVPFTECPWTSLLSHSEIYSPYGIGFTKDFVFNKDGAPVFYVRADRWDDSEWNNNSCFITPFWPEYRHKKVVQRNKTKFYKEVDYSHEREWRVPHDLTFEYNDIAFVITDKHDDIKNIPEDTVMAIGLEKFLVMDNYKTVEKLWPVHLSNKSTDK